MGVKKKSTPIDLLLHPLLLLASYFFPNSPCFCWPPTLLPLLFFPLFLLQTRESTHAEARRATRDSTCPAAAGAFASTLASTSPTALPGTGASSWRGCFSPTALTTRTRRPLPRAGASPRRPLSDGTPSSRWQPPPRCGHDIQTRCVRNLPMRWRFLGGRGSLARARPAPVASPGRCGQPPASALPPPSPPTGCALACREEADGG